MEQVFVSASASQAHGEGQEQPKSYERLVCELLKACAQGVQEAFLVFFKGAGKEVHIDKSDREVVMHYALRQILTQTIADPCPASDSVDLDRKTQWESLIALLIADCKGDADRAARHPALQAACAESVKTLANVRDLETVIRDVPAPGFSSGAACFVSTLLNDLEGKLSVDTADLSTEANAQGVHALEGLGSILCGRVQAKGGDGYEAAVHFLVHELSDHCGLDGFDREIVLHFAAKELIARTTDRAYHQGKIRPDYEVLTREWEAMLRLAAYCGHAGEEFVKDPHRAISRAFEAARENNGGLEVLATVASLLGDDTKKLYLGHLVTGRLPTSLGGEGRLAA